MNKFSTHVLDVAQGLPASSMSLSLWRDKNSDFSNNAEWQLIAAGQTDRDGRAPELLSPEQILDPGIYRVRFETQAYFENRHVETFYPWVDVVFRMTKGQHYHVPLLISPYSYSTYRGS